MCSFILLACTCQIFICMCALLLVEVVFGDEYTL